MIFSQLTGVRRRLVEILCRFVSLNSFPRVLTPPGPALDDTWNSETAWTLESDQQVKVDLRSSLSLTGYQRLVEKVCPLTLHELYDKIVAGEIHASTHTNASGLTRMGGPGKMRMLLLNDGTELQVLMMEHFQSLSVQFDYYELQEIRKGHYPKSN